MDSRQILDEDLTPIKSMGTLMMLIMLVFSTFPNMIADIAIAQESDEETGNAPEDVWSLAYVNQIHPWGGDDRIQFIQYHDYFTMRDRMMELTEKTNNRLGYSIMEFHEGLNGGINKRGQETTADSYEGWFYNHPSPWVKITGGGEEHNGVDGGECNQFVGDCGNYADIPDIQLVGNHHAREWMSYEVPMMFLETVAHYYGTAGIDNDGDGLIDEDPFGDMDGDGIIDDDGDCLSLDTSFQDSNGDGELCGPGDLGVDEDFSEEWITNLVDTREIYLIPMLNVDGNRYDREVFCGEDAWNCESAGWRKNLRDNTVTGVTPLPDIDEEVDSSCDGVDLNRNYQFEWGAPLGATGPLFPGMCYAGGPNNDVYNGPVDDTDNDDDGQVNEDHVDGKDDDADGLTDEDWWGGNSEPETKFIQDLTEMNDDDGNGASDFAATLTWHSYSELVLYPWGHCTNCQTDDHLELIYHGDKMAEMTTYENMQSSDLYPTTGDYCDWHYGVHNSYCYTIEIGTAFHQVPEDINHIAVRNLGVPFYMVEIADDPRERARIGLEEADKSQWIITPENLTVPEEGPVPITMCVDPIFPWTSNETYSHVMWRLVKPTRSQSNFGPSEWVEEEWSMTGFNESGKNCTLTNMDEGILITANIPIPGDTSGKLHYKSMLGTRSGTFPFAYPAPMGTYHVIDIPYRAPFGSAMLSFMLFAIVAGAVWGGLGKCLHLILSGDEKEIEWNKEDPVGA